jgi:hypothetical protein
MVIASVFGVSTAIGAAGTTAVQLLLFMFTETDPAATHFTSLPGTAAVGGVGLLVWWHHRTSLGEERTNAVRSYGYAMAAIGLGISIGGATGLATVAFSPADFINDPTEAVIAVIVILVTGLSVWGWYWTRAQAAPRETEAGATPRRFYLVGLAVITGLVSAGALIGTLVVLFQLLIAGESNDTMALQASLFVFSGLATWHLLRANGKDRELIVSPDVVTPFDLTIVCSHPGPIATLVPKEARVKILYRGDDVGLITETMASAIVEEVGQRSSIVWVDDRGYRIAAAR